MMDLFRLNEIGTIHQKPLVWGLISAAKMSTQPSYSGPGSSWEGAQLPSVIHHQGRPAQPWTGAYQACKFDYLDFGNSPVPVFGLDWSTERVYRDLSLEDPEAVANCAIGPHHASVISLDSPLSELNEKQKQRRRACEEFIF